MKDEDFLVWCAKRYRTYLFYKRNRWIRYIPFMQMRYEWVLKLWKDMLDDCESSIKMLRIKSRGD